MVAHDDKDELYVAIYSKMEHDVILFYEQGGVEVGDIDAKAHKLVVPVQMKDSEMALPDDQLTKLVVGVESSKRS